MPEAAHHRAVQGALPRWEEAGVELHFCGDLILVREDLNLMDARGVVQAQDELLGELGEARALPSARLRGVEVELARGVVLVLWRGRRGRGKDGTMSGRPEQTDEKEEEINNLKSSVVSDGRRDASARVPRRRRARR